MVVNKKTIFVKKKVVKILFVRTDFVRTVFAVSMISSDKMTESSTIHAKYLPFSQLNVAGFEI